MDVTPPKQARSRRTLERIVEAAEAILEEDGPDALTVQEVVRRADSSVGSFYARFGGKDDLLDYMVERVWRDAAARWDEAVASERWHGLSLDELVAGAVKLLSDVGGPDSVAGLRALENAGVGGRVAFVSFRDHVLDGLTEVLLARRGDIAHPDPETAVRVALQAAAGVVHQRRRPHADSEVVRAEVVRMVRGYLTGEGAGAGPPAPGVEFFDIWE